MYIIKFLILSGIFAMMQACTQVDNYILGKENIPQPKKLDSIHPKVKMTNQWTTAVGKKNKYHSYLKLKPVIVKDRIYAADTNGSAYAVNKENGMTIWSTKIPHSILSGPVVKGSTMVVGTDAATIVVLNSVNGNILWTANLSGDTLSKPLVFKDKVIVKTIDGNLYAFNLHNGEKVWKVEHGSPSLILKASSSPVLMGDLVLVGFSDGKLDAIDINTGRLVWQRSMAYATGASDIDKLIDIDADPIIQQNVIYVASYQGYIGAFSLVDGKFIWNKTGSVYKNMAISNDVLYVVDSKDTVWAFNKNTGRVLWKQIALKYHDLTEPVLIANKLLVGDKDGYLHVLSTRTGELIGRAKLSSGISMSSSVSNDIAYTMLKNGYMNATKIS